MENRRTEPQSLFRDHPNKYHTTGGMFGLGFVWTWFGRGWGVGGGFALIFNIQERKPPTLLESESRKAQHKIK